jgi:hypothetical protein
MKFSLYNSKSNTKFMEEIDKIENNFSFAKSLSKLPTIRKLWEKTSFDVCAIDKEEYTCFGVFSNDP